MKPQIDPEPPLVLIALASYNLSDYIEETLESARTQRYTNFECIVVDDGSQDASPDIAEAFCERNSRFRTVRQENRGGSNARNRGLELASAEAKYVLFLDSDDVLLPDALDVMVAHLEQHPEVVAVYTESEIIDRFGNPMPELQAQYSAKRFVPRGPFLRTVLPDEPETTIETLLAYMTARPTSTLYRVDMFRQHGWWDQEAFPWDDNDLMARLMCHHHVHYLPLILSKYRVHDFNASKIRLNTPPYQYYRRKLWHLTDVPGPQMHRVRRAMIFERYVEVLLCLRDAAGETLRGRFTVAAHRLRKGARALGACLGMLVNYLGDRFLGVSIPVWRLFQQLDFCQPASR